MYKLIIIFAAVLILCGFGFGQNFYLGNVEDNCSACHANPGGMNQVTTWLETGHAIAQDSINNPFFGYSCLQCHNTGWDVELDNYGADAYVDSSTDNSYIITDSTNWNRVKNIGCEECHGPLGDSDRNFLGFNEHQAAAVVDYTAEICGYCHQDSHHPFLEEWLESAHGTGPNQRGSSIPPFFNRTNNGTCYRCHSAEDFIAYLEDPEYDGTTFVPRGDSLGNPVSITCVTCHNPHGTENPGNLRVPVSGESVICDVCHTVGIEGQTVDFRSTPHHTTSEALSGSPLFGYQYPGETYQNSAHTFVATERCINCHVSMEGEGEFGEAVGHTFEPRIEACAVDGCHGAAYYTQVDTSDQEKKFDLNRVQTITDSLIGVLEDMLANASTQDSLTDVFAQAVYNLHAIESEGSHGVHNTALVHKLLQDAIDSDFVTAIDERDEVPLTYNLAQNFPNPFNPTTEIAFSIKKTGHVLLTVYDMLGREVITLVDSDMQAGTHKTQFNATHLSTGIYIYRIQSSEFSAIRKMVLLK